jgi:hypothetical protein
MKCIFSHETTDYYLIHLAESYQNINHIICKQQNKELPDLYSANYN